MTKEKESGVESNTPIRAAGAPKAEPRMKRGQVKKQITRCVEVELTSDLEHFQNGFLSFMAGKVTVSSKGKERGWMAASTQGESIYGHIAGRSWAICVDQLWPIFEEADAKYLAALAKARGEAPKAT